MKRSAFTMVELIFVIVIIGILASVGIPKFSGVKDNAKANSEISAFNSLNSVIVSTIETHLQDFKDTNISWHNTDLSSVGFSIPYTSSQTAYGIINTSNKVFQSIAVKNEKFRIIGVTYSNGTQVVSAGSSASGSNHSNDILFLVGDASNRTNGINAPLIDIVNKPDKNDFWVFNPNSFDIYIRATNIIGDNDITPNRKKINAQSLQLIDVNGSSAFSISSGVYVGNYLDDSNFVEISNPIPITKQ